MFLVILCLVLNLSLIIGHAGEEDELRVGPTPIVLWNGKMNSCESDEITVATSTIKSETSLSSAYIKCLKWNSNRFLKAIKSVFRPISKSKLVDMACKMIAEDKKLQRGYHAVGFGKGGLYLRAVAQKCSNPPIFNLITLGTQHQGKFGKAEDDKFLADINNEDINNPNELYRTNLIKLKNLVLYRFQFDSQIDPPESSWFGFYGKDDYVVRPMTDSELYKEDRIGLKTLNEGGKIHTIEGMGVHLQVLENLFMKSIVKPYLTENYWVDTDKKSSS